MRAQPAGVGVYVASLAHALAERDRSNLTLLGVRPEAGSLDGFPDSVTRIPFRDLRIGRRRTQGYHAWLQYAASRDLRAARADVAHFTNAAAPLRSAVPYVVTVHDLSLIRLPHLHRVARLATLPMMLAAIARAKAVIVPSDWVRRDVIRGLRVARNRVVSVEHAPISHPADEAVADGLAQFGLGPGEYLLSIGTVEPRKNIVRLVGAFERLAQERPGLRLVLVGAPGWRRAGIERRLADSPMSHRIIATGYLPEDVVQHLVINAAVVCYVSLYEGYGLPIVEAMGRGAAVVASDRTGMPQAAGGAGVLVDPYNELDIARGIEEALDRRDELISAGLQRARRRSWLDVASEHQNVYRWAAARP